MPALLCQLLFLYTLVVLARVILSWFPITPGTPMASVSSFLYTVTEPVLGPVRRMIPSMGVGGMGFDLSPLIVLLGIQLLLSVAC